MPIGDTERLMGHTGCGIAKTWTLDVEVATYLDRPWPIATNKLANPIAIGRPRKKGKKKKKRERRVFRSED